MRPQALGNTVRLTRRTAYRSFFDSGSRISCRMPATVAVLALVMTLGTPQLDIKAQEGGSDQFQRLITLCRESKFRPIDQQLLNEALNELRSAVKRLDKRLDQAGTVGQQWREFLKWSQLVRQLEAEKQDPAELEKVLQRFASGYFGLELACFADVRRKLERYITLLRAADHPQLEQYCQALLRQAEHLLQSRPTSGPQLVQLMETIDQLHTLGQSPQLVAAVRQVYDKPNVLGWVSPELATLPLNRPIDDVSPVEDVILGTKLKGTGHTKGQLIARLLDSNEEAQIELLITGTIETDSIGRNGPVRVKSRGTTKITTRKVIRFNENGFILEPASSQATTDSTIEKLWAVRGGCIVECIAWRRARRQKPLSEAIAAEHAEERMNRRVDSQVQEQLGPINDRFVQLVRQPLLDRAAFPEHFLVQSNARGLSFEALFSHFDTPGTLRPAAINSNCDLVFAVHESAVNFALADLFRSVRVEEARLAEWFREMVGHVPPALEQDDEQPWTVLLAHDQPVEVTFAEGKFSISVRGRRYQRGTEGYPGMNVTARYEIISNGQPDRPMARRVGDLEIWPPGYAPGKGQRLSARQQVLKTLLQRRFGKIFREELTIEDITLPERWPKRGRLRLTEWKADDGWMILGFKLFAEDTDQTHAENPG